MASKGGTSTIRLAFVFLVIVVVLVCLAWFQNKSGPLLPVPLFYRTTNGTDCLSLYNDGPVSLVRDEIYSWAESFPAVWVNHTGLLDDRLAALNNKLSKIRRKMLQRYLGTEWRPLHPPLKIIDGTNADYLSAVAHTCNVILIALPWITPPNRTNWNSLTDRQNLLIQEYYEWTAESILCKWIKSGITHQRWHIVYNYMCTSDKTKAISPKSLASHTLNARPAHATLFPFFPKRFSDEPPNHVTYIIVAPDAVFTEYGDLVTHDVKLVPMTCHRDVITTFPLRSQKSLPVYQEVFSIVQFWGTEYYHKNIETLPRIAPYIKFLKEHPDIKVHVNDMQKYGVHLLEILGISESRLITGSLRAKVAYFPELTYCGFNHVVTSQLLSRSYRETIHKDLKENEKRSNIVLIRRTKSRKFVHQVKIEKMLETVGEEHKLKLKIFKDDPVPSLKQTMLMFNRAALVVAPHGAGLSNIIYCEPGTYVIEGVCNTPHVNMCYERLAETLGHHWHGIPARQGCEEEVDIDVGVIERAVLAFLPNVANLAN